MSLSITGGTCLLPEGFAPADLRIAEGVLAPPGPASRRLDARGLLVPPGIVDLHGDAFERQIQPRPGVGFPLPLALADTEAQLLANGITTEKADLTFASVPYRIMHEFQIPVYAEMKKRDAGFYERLEAAGFKLDFGDDESGLFMKYLRRGSGYYIGQRDPGSALSSLLLSFLGNLSKKLLICGSQIRKRYLLWQGFPPKASNGSSTSWS
jgi:hypothetical protein